MVKLAIAEGKELKKKCILLEIGIIYNIHIYLFSRIYPRNKKKVYSKTIHKDKGHFELVKVFVNSGTKLYICFS